MDSGNGLVVIPGGDQVINLVAATTAPALMIDDNEQIQEDPNRAEKKDMHSQNLEKLREMQERREKEKKMIEEERAKVQRRQEKMKLKILKEAQAFKAMKEERKKKQLQEEEELKKNQETQKGKVSYKDSVSPERIKPRKPLYEAPQSPKGPEVVSPEDEKTEEEKAEEKKKLDMMRKYYRNRHATLLKALVE